MDPTIQTPQPLPNQSTSQQKSRRRDTLSTIAIIIAAPLIALFLVAFVFQSYEVQGPSMLTTLHDKDRLIVIKAAKTWSKITGNAYIPERYDIIIFNKQEASINPEETNQKQLIKRVIGLPGDRVVIKDGEVTIYNGNHPAGFKPDKEGPHAGVIKFTSGNDVNMVIGSDEVFVMGDNRSDSLDSRIFGPVHASDIVGRLAVRILPLDQKKTF